MMDEKNQQNIITKEEMREAAKNRVEEISKEFRAGFSFLENYPKSVTFFGGNKFSQDNPYCIKAKSLSGRIVKELGYSVLTGGGPGIMEAANRGAYEAGGNSLGLTIQLPHEQITNKFLTKHINFYYFFVRKLCLTYSAEAFIFFPGGFGTLDEFSEILTLIQTKKITSGPIILVGSDYWKPLENFIKEQMLLRNTIDKEDLSLYTITDDENEIIEIIKKVPIKSGIPFDSKTGTDSY